MNRFLIFNTEKDYDQGSLEQHLNYLRQWGGTPDCWTSADTIHSAREQAHDTGFETVIYDRESEKTFNVNNNKTDNEE